MASETGPAKRDTSWIPGLPPASAIAPRRAARRSPSALAHVAHEHAGASTTMRTPIVAFAKDWHEDPTSNHHILRELAKTRRVLWINSLATRAPSRASGRDPGKLVRKLAELAHGPIHVEHDLWVATPLVLPLPHSATVRAINRELLRATIRALRRRLGITEFQLWTFLPNTGDYVGTLGESLSIYYCVDEWSRFSYLDKEQIAAAERSLLRRVDAVFAVNHALADEKRPHNPASYVSVHGVDHALFARALDDATRVPPELAALPHPRIGFHGTLRDWVDEELIAHVARARPAWSIVLIGQQLAELAAIRGAPNVHLLGRRRHDELPAYCKGFDVGIIPYRLDPIDERMRYVNPLKLREYLSAGLPVVSTAVPEVQRYAQGPHQGPPLCRVATTPDDFVAALELALGETTLAARGARSAAMKHETWRARVEELTRTVEEIARAKTGGTAPEDGEEEAPAMMKTTYRAGMVGAGNICEFHVAAVQKLGPEVELVGITDLDPARATVNARKWGTTSYADLDALVAAGANVIHVLTPPAAHGAVARAALEHGCHVLIEKPITEDADEARALAELARRKGLTITVNHSLLYDPQITRALAAVRAGELGDVVSVDVLRGSEYPPYEGGPLPPWYRDAGYPFRDLGVHCLYLIQELLGPIEEVEADWRALGGDPDLAFDEWRALVRCRRGLGQFQLTYNVKPMQSQLIIHGTKGVLRVDLFAMFHGKRGATPLPKPAERLLNAFTDSLQPLLDVPVGVYKFVRKQVQAYQGLRDLVAEFYRRLAANEPPPVEAADAANVVHWVEKVARAAEAFHAANLARFTLSGRVPYLVTGASGSLGNAVVARLRAEGHRVRVFQRRIPVTAQDGVEYAFGNLGDPVAVDRAVRGAEVVIHCGAAMKGGWPEHKGGTVVGTQNVIDACLAHGVRQLVHISSMSVIDWAGSVTRGPVREDAELEPRPDERGAYTRAKLEAELLVAAAARRGLPVVILRPGQIFGGGIPLITGAVARSAAGRWLVLGDGKLELPLVYIDDVVESILLAIERELTGGELFQIIDPDRLTQEDVLGLAGGPRAILRVPRSLVFALGKLSELPLGALGKPSPIARYRLASALARLHYESDHAARQLGWAPKVGVREGIRRVLSGAPPAVSLEEPVPRAAIGA